MYLLIVIDVHSIQKMQILLNSVSTFMEKKPGILKRAVVTPTKIVAWSTQPQDIIITEWNKHSSLPLRLVPLLPREGGLTQQKWNDVWDSATPFTKGVRQLYGQAVAEIKSSSKI